MSGFIQAIKIDKIDLGEGVVMKGEITAALSGPIDRFMAAFESFLADWRDRAAKDQLTIDFSDSITISGVSLRADKPKLKDKKYEVCLEMTGMSLDDRSKLFNFSQDDSKIIHVKITTESRRGAKKKAETITEAAPPTTETTETAKPTQAATEKPRKCRVCGCTEDNACQTGAGPCSWANENLDLCTACAEGKPKEVVDHGMTILDLPTFEADSVEERLQAALLIRGPEALGNWAGRIKTGLTDKDLRKALDSEWTRGAQYEASDDGKHFIVQSGATPKFRLAPSVGVRANLTSKPTLEGAKLLAKIREVLGLSDPSAKQPSKRTAARVN